MKLNVLLAALAVVLVFLLITLRMFLRRPRYPYRARPILTKREQSFYLLLWREASRRNLLICPKVGLKDLLEVTNRRHYMKYFRQIAQKHVDFVICDRNLQVLFAIELDDSSHDTADAKHRDQFKDRAFRAAKIPLKRIRSFDESAVRDLFKGI
jgi:hypothetical protein